MSALLIALTAWALMDSINVLNIGVMTAIVYTSRLARRSPLPGGLSFIAGIFAAITVFGMCAVLGVTFLADAVDFDVTPKVRYWTELALGSVLLLLGSYRTRVSARPRWAMRPLHPQPWLLGIIGMAIGLGQAPTSIPYLAGLALLSARKPLPDAWPVIVVGYCAITVWPLMLILALSMKRTARALRMQRTVVKIINRYGATATRVLFLFAGMALVIDGLLHHTSLL